MTSRRDELLSAYAGKAARRMIRAGEVLVERQVVRGPARGNVVAFAGSDDLDFHGTLAALWLWLRAQIASGEARFGAHVAAAWGFVERHWEAFIPRSLSASASDEAAYDCAMVMRACLATHAVTGTGDWRRFGDVAARLVAGFLSDLSEATGRGFLDPGFLAWTLAEYARAIKDRGLSASVGRFVDKNFGTRSPGVFAEEPQEVHELFDFSSTTATRILSVIACEGETPFTGTWLRERVAKLFSPGVLPRAQDENTWNACVATAAGRAYLASTDERFYDIHQAIVDDLVGRSGETGGALGRAAGFPSETLATFYYGLALDSMVRQEQAGIGRVS